MPVQIGDKAPDFNLPNQYNQIVRLKDFRGFQVVLFSFPKAGTPHCTKHACAYRDAYQQFQRSGALVLGITSNSVEDLNVWREEHQFPYDLLSDASHETLIELGAWGYDILGLIEIPAAQRCYWVMDEEGIIRDMEIGIGPIEGVEKSLAFVEQSAQQSTIPT